MPQPIPDCLRARSSATLPRAAWLVALAPLAAIGTLSCSSGGDSSAEPAIYACGDAASDQQTLPPDAATQDATVLDGATPDSGNGDAAPDAAADQATPPDAGPAPLRIMTFNIKHGGISSLEAIAEVIRDEQPDLVGLQEVDVDAERSGTVDQPHRLSQLTGMADLFRTALTLSDGGLYGLALLSRFPIITSTKTLLTSGSEQRILVVVDVLTDQGTLPVAITHLGLTASERDTQATEILAQLGAEPNAILMGDFNADADDPEIVKLAASMTDAWASAGSGPGYTIPSDTPTRRIDFIFLGAAWPAPMECHVPDTTASDHRPVVTTVAWPGAE